jgi:c-di-GMP-binding flagellar brake protein YcgR
MVSGDLQILHEAAARNSSIVLSLPSAGMLRHYKSRFLTVVDDGLWVESAAGEIPLIKELLATRQPVGISFRSGVNKIIFTAPLMRFAAAHRVNDETEVEAILIARPAEIKSIQRRNSYRVRVTPESELTVRVWKIADHAYLNDRPLAAQEIKTELLDISIGGLGVIFRAKDGQEPRIVPGQRVRVELKYQEALLLLDGRFRAPAPSEKGETLRTGITLKPLDSQLEGRQKLAQLTRIVSTLQREEVRRLRRGSAA